MKRILAIWLPNWSARRLGSNKPERASPAVDPLADRQALVELARWCHRFAPTVGIEDSPAPETLLLDVTNLAPLYGGEQRLISQVRQGLIRLGLDARMALADTIGAAWALAHFGQSVNSVNLEGCHGHSGPPRWPCLVETITCPPRKTGVGMAPQTLHLGSLSIAALRLPDELLDTLGHLGVERVGDLLTLPRDQLRSRFGPLLALRLDQALGTASEVSIAVDPPEEFVAEQTLDYLLANQEAVAQVVRSLLTRLAWLLAARCAGALRVACRLTCETGPTVEFEIGLFQPSASAGHLLELVELELERLRLPGPVAAVAVEATAHAPLAERQGVLFDEDRSLGSSRRLSGLIDRLVGRLGRAAVVRCRLVSEAQPELAYCEEALVGAKDGSLKQGVAGPLKRVLARGALDRPLCLLNRPAPLETVSVVPEGPPVRFRRGGHSYQIARQWGPERIETGWWRGRSAGRDYYRVETTEGRRFWLYRRRRDGRWFLHGLYE